MFWENFVGLCAEKGKTPTAVVLEIGLARSSVTNWKRGGCPNNVAIRKIANYFNVSINYLLGTEGNVTISGNTLKGTYNIVGNQPKLHVSEEITAQEKELLSCFRKLSEVEKAKALIYIAELGEDDR